MTVRVDVSQLRPPDVPYVARMTPLDVPGAQPLLFPENPNEDETLISPMWQSRAEAGALESSHDWTHNDPKTISFTLELYNVDSTELEIFLLTLEDFAKRPTDLTQRPTRVAFEAGNRTLIGIIKPLSIVRLQLDRKGQATHAQISLTIAENSNPQ